MERTIYTKKEIRKNGYLPRMDLAGKHGDFKKGINCVKNSIKQIPNLYYAVIHEMKA